MKIDDRSLKFNENQWKIYENQWESIKNLWKSLKINEKSMKINENQPKPNPKSNQKRPQTSLGGSRGAIWAPRWLREPTWPRKPANLTPWGAPSWEPKSTQNRQKIDPKFNKFLDHFFDWFWSPLGVDLVRFWGPKWSQNWSRIGLKSDHEANVNMLKNHWFLYGFWGSEVLRIDQKSFSRRC